MKKIIMLLAVAVLMFGFSGQAMATTVYGDLIQVIYKTNSSTTTEYVTDLGSLSSLTSLATPSGYTLGNSNLFGLGTSLSNYQVAYLVSSNASASTLSVSGDATGSQTGGNAQGAFSGAYNNFIGAAHGTAWTTVSGFGTAQVLMSNANSYYNQMNYGDNLIADGATGSFNGFLYNNNGEATILGSAVTQYLYQYANPNNMGNGTQGLEIVTNANGSTDLIGPAAATPVPPAVLLFGSGLLGLVGIRRKQSV